MLARPALLAEPAKASLQRQPLLPITGPSKIPWTADSLSVGIDAAATSPQTATELLHLPPPSWADTSVFVVKGGNSEEEDGYVTSDSEETPINEPEGKEPTAQVEEAGEGQEQNYPNSDPRIGKRRGRKRKWDGSYRSGPLTPSEKRGFRRLLKLLNYESIVKRNHAEAASGSEPSRSEEAAVIKETTQVAHSSTTDGLESPAPNTACGENAQSGPLFQDARQQKLFDTLVGAFFPDRDPTWLTKILQGMSINEGIWQFPKEALQEPTSTPSKRRKTTFATRRMVAGEDGNEGMQPRSLLPLPSHWRPRPLTPAQIAQREARREAKARAERIQAIRDSRDRSIEASQAYQRRHLQRTPKKSATSTFRRKQPANTSPSRSAMRLSGKKTGSPTSKNVTIWNRILGSLAWSKSILVPKLARSLERQQEKEATTSRGRRKRRRKRFGAGGEEDGEFEDSDSSSDHATIRAPKRTRRRRTEEDEATREGRRKSLRTRVVSDTGRNPWWMVNPNQGSSSPARRRARKARTLPPSSDEDDSDDQAVGENQETTRRSDDKGQLSSEEEDLVEQQVVAVDAAPHPIVDVNSPQPTRWLIAKQKRPQQVSKSIDLPVSSNEEDDLDLLSEKHTAAPVHPADGIAFIPAFPPAPLSEPVREARPLAKPTPPGVLRTAGPSSKSRLSNSPKKRVSFGDVVPTSQPEEDLTARGDPRPAYAVASAHRVGESNAADFDDLLPDGFETLAVPSEEVGTGANALAEAQQSIQNFAMQPDVLLRLLHIRELARVTPKGQDLSGGDRLTRVELAERLTMIKALIDGYVEEEPQKQGSKRLGGKGARSRGTQGSTAPVKSRAVVMKQKSMKRRVGRPRKESAAPAADEPSKQPENMGITARVSSSVRESASSSKAASPRKIANSDKALQEEMSNTGRARRGAAVKAAQLTAQQYKDPWAEGGAEEVPPANPVVTEVPAADPVATKLPVTFPSPRKESPSRSPLERSKVYDAILFVD